MTEAESNVAEPVEVPPVEPAEGQAEHPNDPTVPNFLAEEKAREEKRQKYERREHLIVFTAAALCGDDQVGASPKSKAVRAVSIAEETVNHLIAQGYLD